jgi:hypothetical protein
MSVVIACTPDGTEEIEGLAPLKGTAGPSRIVGVNSTAWPAPLMYRHGSTQISASLGEPSSF